MSGSVVWRLVAQCRCPKKALSNPISPNANSAGSTDVQTRLESIATVEPALSAFGETAYMYVNGVGDPHGTA